MAKKPGVHTSTIMALKSQVLNKYVVARAWEYTGKNDYKVRYLFLEDRPVMVSRSIKTARKLIDLIPERAKEMLAEEETELVNAIKDLDRAMQRGGGGSRHLIDHFEARIKRSEEIIGWLRALLSGPIDVVRIESVTTVTETVV